MEDSVRGGPFVQRVVAPRRLRTMFVHRLGRQAVVAAVLVAAVLMTVIATFAASKTARIQRSVSWGLVVLCSMAGWGWVVERLGLPRRRADLGLRLAWGAGGLLGVGGVLCVSSLATRPVLLALILGGTFLTVANLIRWGRAPSPPDVMLRSRRWSPGAITALVALMVLAATYFLGGASGADLNQNDDHVAYLIFPKKILATGTLIDPFSLRRVQAFGGHSFLQALTLLGGSSPLQIGIFDHGIALMVVIALVLGSARPQTPRALKSLWILPVMLAVSVPNIRANTASEVSGVMIFLALFRTASWDGFDGRPVARAAVLGMLAAAVCTLRQSYLISAAVFMIVFYLPRAIAAIRPWAVARRENLMTVGVAAGTLLLFLLPWMILAYRSDRTFLFPLMKGNYHTEYGVLTSVSKVDDRIRFFWANICHCHPIHSLPFFLFAGMLIPGRKTGGALPALLWASVAGFIALVYSLPMADEANIARYYYGFMVATALAVLIAAFSALRRRSMVTVRAQTLVPAVLAIGALVAHVQEGRTEVYADYLKQESVISKARARESSLAPRGETYRKLQDAVPVNAPMLVMLEESFWFNFKRNRIDILDLPGAVSPPPGMPLDDDEKLVQYLTAQGYRYLAFVRSAACKSLLYKRTHPSPKVTATDALIWRLTFDRFDGLAKSRVSVYDDGQMVALDLATLRHG